jgi:uncharacterized protein (TIGR02246 family)
VESSWIVCLLLVHQAQVSINRPGETHPVILSGVDDREAIIHAVEESLSQRQAIGENLNDERQIEKLFDDGDRALVSADSAELSRIFADDYVQYDESGQSSSKQDVIGKLTSRAIRYVSMVSTSRHIRMLRDDVAIVHGSEVDTVEQGGKRFPIHYVYMDVVVKRDGRWQIVASQLAKAFEREANR